LKFIDMEKDSCYLSGLIKHGIKTPFLASFILCLFLSIQGSGQVVAVFENSHNYLKTDNGLFQSEFMLEADKETYNLVVSNANKMPETFTFTSDKIKKNKYKFSILFTHPTDPPYVKKILLTLGIEQLKINNIIYKLPDFEPVTY
jgi:hypothetical protein